MVQPSIGVTAVPGINRRSRVFDAGLASRRAIADASQVIAELRPQARQMAASLNRLLAPTPDGPREP
ncbi:hypothetical protein [Burkholderia ambifaria]|uniref:hypothetical protein n=1 Tax=Burkholderia ambifaria TaxID=152480 RepID=UPI00158B6A82|nr:hypothetical protein [Burkholderia ambifaria]